MTDADPLIIHLVGSVPLDSAESTFRWLSQAFTPSLKRLVDGETGRRASWIGFLRGVIQAHPAFEEDTDHPPLEFVQWDGKKIGEWRYLRLRDGVDPNTLTFDTGYADDAIRSFELFSRLRDAGEIPTGVSYQACAGTPLATAYLWISPDSRKAYLDAYTRHLGQEIRKIADALPHDQLAWQWDVAPEVLMWEGNFEQSSDYREETLTSLAAVGDLVPPSIDMGYHFCYGSPRDEHLVQPKDLTVLVEMTNGILHRLQRPIGWIHFPVPVDRRDDAYFQPLHELQLPAETEFYLGCVHPGEDDGNAQRLARARAHTRVDGIGSECGWGRGDPAKLDAIRLAHQRLVASS